MQLKHEGQGIPIIDVSSFRDLIKSRRQVAMQIRRACTLHGFFYISHHSVSLALQQKLERLTTAFFAQAEASKMTIAMNKGGLAWRGYFPVGGELTSGKPDLKEGLYLGTELAQNHPLVIQQTPMHGPNLFPDIPEFRETILSYLQAMSKLGHLLMEGIALSLDLDFDYFHNNYTKDPLILFRLFHYPPAEPLQDNHSWGVGEHTDYGLLTILKQDGNGGLEVRSGDRWITAPPIANTFVCNIGDMLDRMTGGYYRSTPHRVRNPSGENRYSWPFFFDPNFAAAVKPIPIGEAIIDDSHQRWDGSSVHKFEGTYGDYLMNKVGQVFPELKSKVTHSS